MATINSIIGQNIEYEGIAYSNQLASFQDVIYIFNIHRLISEMHNNANRFAYLDTHYLAKWRWIIGIIYTNSIKIERVIFGIINKLE